jgi:hypothetical protein
LRGLITSALASILRAELVRLGMITVSSSSPSIFASSQARRIAFGLLSGSSSLTPKAVSPTPNANVAIPTTMADQQQARASLLAVPNAATIINGTNTSAIVRSWSGADIASLRNSPSIMHTERTPIGLVARLTSIINVPTLTMLVLPQLLHRYTSSPTTRYDNLFICSFCICDTD